MANQPNNTNKIVVVMKVSTHELFVIHFRYEELTTLKKIKLIN
jgi:hypothetical protein